LTGFAGPVFVSIVILAARKLCTHRSFTCDCGEYVCFDSYIHQGMEFPRNRDPIEFINSFLSAVLIIPAIPVWNIANSTFQIGLILTTGAFVVAVCRKSLGIKKIIPVTFWSQ
tara:strand:+ start:1022 stop:1360 length:339 start_codon:yes stop_codon:yes gene_type:complete